MDAFMSKVPSSRRSREQTASGNSKTVEASWDDLDEKFRSLPLNFIVNIEELVS